LGSALVQPCASHRSLDLFGRPERPPHFDPGVASTWWWDEEKARKINFTGR